LITVASLVRPAADTVADVEAVDHPHRRGEKGIAEVLFSVQQLPPARGEDTTNAPTGCGGTCSNNNLRTVRDFYQEFPLTSRPKTETIVKVSSGATLSTTMHYWNGQQSAPGQPWLLFQVGSEEAKYENSAATAGAFDLVSVTTSIAQISPLSGEASTHCTITAGSGAQTGYIQLVNRILTDDTVNWWLGRDDGDAVYSDAFAFDLATYSAGSSPVLRTPILSGNLTLDINGTLTVLEAAYAIPAPSCPAVSANAVNRKTTNVWFPFNATTPGSPRKLQYQKVNLGPNLEHQTQYVSYDTYGNPTETADSARDVGIDSVYPPASTAVTELQRPDGTPAHNHMTYTTGADPGYFLATATNPLGHMATVVTDPATGKPISRQQIQGGPRSVFNYDGFGRVIQTVIDDGSGSALAAPKYEGVQSSSLPGIPVKHVTVQGGAPTKVDYIDLLGRTVATGTQDMLGHEVISKVDYNERGLKLATHEPLSTSGVLTATGAGGVFGSWDGATSSQWTTQYSKFDVFGRVGQKIVARNPAIGAANMTTGYAFMADPLGTKTAITVTRASGDLTMSRTYDRRGKLAQTLQHVNSPPHDIVVSYGYDAPGNLTSITDSASNVLSATYDELGRKQTINDPDRGKWSFTWDGLGRVRTTTDSNSTVVALQYDAIGRTERRFVSRAGGSFRLDANWQYDLNGKLGTLGKMLGADDGAALNAAAPAFERDYGYDAHLRPANDTVTVAGGATWDPDSFTVGLAYDDHYGRMKGIAFPSGEVVALDYDPGIGFPIGETPVIAGGGRDPSNHYRRVTALSPRGQITAQQFANGTVENTTFDDSTGLSTSIYASGLSHETLPPPCQNATVSMVKQLDYTYDLFTNLQSQKKTFYPRNSASGQILCSGNSAAIATATETYAYDDLQRLTGASRVWTGMTWQSPTTPADSYSYDDLGNITSKSDYADQYIYNVTRADTSKLPHAVGAVSLGGVNKANFTYDANGNLTSGDGRQIVFDDFDRPVKITMGSVTTIFRYAPDGSRYLQQTTTSSGGSAVTKTIHYLGKYYERVDWSDGKTMEEHTYIGSSIAVYQSGSKRDVRYMHLDRLGSVEAVTNTLGAEVTADAHSFDAFGKPRARDWQAQDKLHPNGDFGATTEHGFTGQEHLDDTYLIHMNGRVYDYRLGRFLSVDPVISQPMNSQAFNPYSYVGNNPFSGVDPTGYEWGMFQDLKDSVTPANGAQGSGSASPSTTTSSFGSPSQIGKFFVGALLGAAMSFNPVPSPVPESFSDPAMNLGFGLGQAGAGIAQIVISTARLSADLATVAGGAVLVPETGPGGLVVAGVGLAMAAGDVKGEQVGFANVSEGASRAMDAFAKMREPTNTPQTSSPPASSEAASQSATTYQTYTKTNPDTGQVYCGRCSGTGSPEQNVANRDSGHHMNEQGSAPPLWIRARTVKTPSAVESKS
jgi:RHS repeat-associated protein